MEYAENIIPQAQRMLIQFLCGRMRKKMHKARNKNKFKTLQTSEDKSNAAAVIEEKKNSR